MAGKCKLDKDAYRPINILNPLEKILEEGIKRQLNKFLEDNNIIADNHHGGRLGHSTFTATAVIDKMTSDSVEDSEETVILTTDLSAAYNLVDHQTLLAKLEYHGVEKSSIQFTRSFLHG